MTFAEQVRKAAAKLGTFTARSLGDEIGIREYREIQRIRDALRDFRRRKEIRIISRGTYEYVPTENAGRGAGVAARIFRAVHAKRTFSTKDIALLCDADTHYTHAVIRRLTASGEVAATGRRKEKGRPAETVYQLVHPDRFYLERVR